MGLDMYMERVKKIDGMTLEEIIETAEYVDFLKRPEEYKRSTFKSWCNGDIKKVRKDKLDEVIANLHIRYSGWDTEKEYGHLGIADGVAYWRKANAIHNWFVNNCGGGIDECQIMEISKEQLEELLKVAQRVKDSCMMVKGKVVNGYQDVNGEWIPMMEDGKIIKDTSVAEELLPTTKGFFFGSTDYDQWYLEDIENTIKQISEILKTTDFDKEYVTYKASW